VKATCGVALPAKNPPTLVVQHLVVDGWPNGRLRLLARDPVAGERPSISVLFASLAKASGADTVAVLLSRDGEDGAAGIKAVDAVGGYLVKAAEAERDGYTLGRRMVAQPVATRDLSTAILKLVQR
jgi:two-component system chemotaxis response regulator CheB